MTDDIVTRLRTKYAGQLPICAEAADEIERLRHKIQDLRMLAEQDACEIERLREPRKKGETAQ